MSAVPAELFQPAFKQGSPLWCIVCAGILDDPQRLPCGHVFCRVCTYQLCELADPPLCPLDRSTFSLGAVMPDRNLRAIIDEHDCKCSNAAAGCDWLGEFQALPEHLRTACMLANTACGQCGASVLRSAIESHAAACPMRLVVCAVCGDDSVLAAELDDHAASTCPQAPESCKCGWHGVRADLPLHESHECPEKLVPCPYARFGCQVSFPRRETAALDDHVASSAADHLLGVVSIVDELAKENAAAAARIEKLEARLAAAPPRPATTSRSPPRAGSHRRTTPPSLSDYARYRRGESTSSLSHLLWSPAQPPQPAARDTLPLGFNYDGLFGGAAPHDTLIEPANRQIISDSDDSDSSEMESLVRSHGLAPWRFPALSDFQAAVVRIILACQGPTTGVSFLSISHQISQLPAAIEQDATILDTISFLTSAGILIQIDDEYWRVSRDYARVIGAATAAASPSAGLATSSSPSRSSSRRTASPRSSPRSSSIRVRRR
ncbi:TNF-receptor-associated factor 1 [Thecamonas trahens ATCC 50062]|uniref:TNF-receptor-associated factor 1 n=1 Tax=Thecamonas trahens ATCC 50062 TaxID=461836 RepID=A0A0L0DW54_THETB|nr:TNF-receptor-associated factor 1 [Thecamonas trahens ATCC 50062]KNC55748.1 TNF-receptor-associated factor 1 [Thecamonas trahens ATCC 50062]|eukprot:XP_013752901.1 TNF-receptor-associated factor 1 [Thecamonas trahens ATCC 50062]